MVQIANVGNVLLKPPGGKVIVRQVLPATTQSLTEVEQDAVSKTQPKTEWPEIGRVHLDFEADELSLEPSEIERYFVDFLITAEVVVVEIHSEVQCGDTSADEYWDETTIVSFSEPPDTANPGPNPLTRRITEA